MKNRIVLFSVFYLALFSIWGQENMLRFEVQQARNANLHFDSVVFNRVSADTRVLKHFIDTSEVFFFGNISLNVRSNSVKAMNLTIPLNNRNMVLELVEVPEYFYDYEVLIMPDSITRPANRNIKHYRGVVRDEINSLAAITLYEGEVMGLVCTNDGNFNIVKDSLSGKHLFYNDRNLRDTTSFTCATEDNPSIQYDSAVLFSQRNNLREEDGTVRGNVINKYVRFYVETRVQIYRKLGRDLDKVEAWVTNIFNQVAILYLNEDIMTYVSCICMWHGGDPYTNSADAELLLEQFKDKTTSISGDLGILLAYYDDPTDGEGIAHIDGLCNSSVQNKLAVARINTFYQNIPVYSRSVKIVTHELGHLMGSRHTHACVWNGDSTAIDGCAGVEPRESGVYCSNPGYPPGGEKGTIMSYCDKPGRPGIDFNLGFGPQPGQVIRTSVTNASCLYTCDVNFTNQTVSTNKILKSACGNVNVQNVKVQSNAKLTIDADKETTIDGDFEVELGSELEIK